jgi:hypothetical protein
MRRWLIIVIAIGTALAIWVSIRSHQHEVEMQTKKSIEQLGGIAMLDHDHVATLNLQLIKDRDAIRKAMQLVVQLPYLQVLDLSKTLVQDDDMAAIRHLKSLVSLHLNDTAITNTGLTHLTDLKYLEGLHVAGTRITDDGLIQIGKLKNLLQLDLSRTDVSDGLIHLDSLDNLVWLVAIDLPLDRQHEKLLLEWESLKRATLGTDQVESPVAEALLKGRPGLNIK